MKKFLEDLRVGRLLLKSNQTAVAINVMEKFNVITALELL